MGTPRSMNQESGGVRRAMPTSLHFLVNGYTLANCALDWGIGRNLAQMSRDVVEVGAETAVQRDLKAKQGDLRGLPTGEGAKPRDLEPEKGAGPISGAELLREDGRGRAVVLPSGPAAPVLPRLTTSLGLVRIQRVAPATTATSSRNEVHGPWRRVVLPNSLRGGRRRLADCDVADARRERRR